MKIKELRNFLNSLNDDIMENEIQLGGVYNYKYKGIKLIDFTNIILDNEKIILDVSGSDVRLVDSNSDLIEGIREVSDETELDDDEIPF